MASASFRVNVKTHADEAHNTLRSAKFSISYLTSSNNW